MTRHEASTRPINRVVSYIQVSVERHSSYQLHVLAARWRQTKRARPPRVLVVQHCVRVRNALGAEYLDDGMTHRTTHSRVPSLRRVSTYDP